MQISRLSLFSLVVSTLSKQKDVYTFKNKLFWIKSCAFNLNTNIISKNLLTQLLKSLETLNFSKIPPIFTYICTFGFGFGIRPKARCFSGFGFGFGLKWKTYFRSFTDSYPNPRIIIKSQKQHCHLAQICSIIHKNLKFPRVDTPSCVCYQIWFCLETRIVWNCFNALLNNWCNLQEFSTLAKPTSVSF